MAQAMKDLALRKDGGVECNTMQEVAQFCQAIITAGFAPKGATPQSLAVAVIFGRDLGLTMMQSIQNIAVINGRACVWGDAVMSLIHQSGELESLEESFEENGGNTTAICEMKRKGVQGVKHGSFSIEDAKVAGLLGKDPWKKYPRRMLQMRARGFVARDLFADKLGGFITAEEAGDYEEREAEYAVKEEKPLIDPDVLAKNKALAAKTREKYRTEIVGDEPLVDVHAMRSTLRDHLAELERRKIGYDFSDEIDDLGTDELGSHIKATAELLS